MKERFWDGPAMVFLNTPASQDTFTIRQAEEGDATVPGGGVAHFGFRPLDKDALEYAIHELP